MRGKREENGRRVGVVVRSLISPLNRSFMIREKKKVKDKNHAEV
jgi:hypothetical protein